jgi:hypothetical protein
MSTLWRLQARVVCGQVGRAVAATICTPSSLKHRTIRQTARDHRGPAGKRRFCLKNFQLAPEGTPTATREEDQRDLNS